MKRIQLLLHPHIKMTSGYDVKWLSTAFNVILCTDAVCVTDFPYAFLLCTFLFSF